MFSTFPAVTLSLPTLFGGNKATPTLSHNSRFKHWEGKRIWLTQIGRASCRERV